MWGRWMQIEIKLNHCHIFHLKVVATAIESIFHHRFDILPYQNSRIFDNFLCGIYSSFKWWVGTIKDMNYVWEVNKRNFHSTRKRKRSEWNFFSSAKIRQQNSNLWWFYVWVTHLTLNIIKKDFSPGWLSTVIKLWISNCVLHVYYHFQRPRI